MGPGTSYIDLRARLDQLRRDLDQAAREAGQAGDKAGRSFSQKMDAFNKRAIQTGKQMSYRISAPLIALGGVVTDAASDLNESMSKVNVVFGDSAKEIKAWAQTAATSMGLSRQQALESAGTFGNLFTAMKIGVPQATDMSKSMIQLASDLASFNNASPEDTLLALRSGLVGETEPLRKFGVNLSAARVEAEALAMGLAEEGEELDAAAKAQAAYSIILKDTTTAQGDFERTADGVANRQRIVTAQFKDAAATLGTQLLPIGQKVLGWAASLASKFNKLSPSTQKVILVLGGLAIAAGPVITAIGAIGTALAFLAANPIALVVAAVAGLAILVVRNWDKIMSATAGLRRVIGNAFSGIASVVKTVGGVIMGIIDRIVGAMEWAYDRLQQLKGLVQGGGLSSAVDKIRDQIGGGGGGGFGPGMGLTDVGRTLQSGGFRVTGHPAFPPVGSHTTGSYHYSGSAIDVNWGTPGESPAEKLRLNAVAGVMKSGLRGIKELFYPGYDPVGGHQDHLHLAMFRGGIIGEPVIGRGLHSGRSYSFGEKGPETVLPGVGGGIVVNLYNYGNQDAGDQVVRALRRHFVRAGA